MEWDLTLIYKTEDELKKDLEKLDRNVDLLVSLKGKINNLEAFEQYAKYNREIDSIISKAFSYLSMKHDLNQKDLESSKGYQMIYSKYMEVEEKLSFVEPEILKNKESDVLEWCNSKEELKPLTFSMKKLFRRNKHVKNAKIEEIMSRYNPALSGYTSLYDSLVIQDNNPVKITLSDGKEVSVSMSSYTSLLMNAKNQEDRRKIFEAQYSFYDSHKKTLAGIYKGIMASEFADAKNRGYKSVLDSILFDNNIDKKVFKSLISVARSENAPVKRYYALRKKYFGFKNLYTYDRFCQFKDSTISYDYETERKMVLEADKGLGEDFYKKAVSVTSDGRVSVMPKDGKRTGAYSTHIYDKGTFILLNDTADLDSAFTLAHEAGHSIHSEYAIEANPYETHDYEIFVAEVASTFNEARFLDYLLNNTKDKNERIVLLQHAIDNTIATFYRQTLFADYEYQAHTLYEKGEVIDEEVLSNIMLDLYKRYYGLDLNKEPLKKFVWAYIPHLFHTPFYVYQYATSFAASQAIYERVSSGDKNAFNEYINMLKAGGSDYPVEIIKKAGVDLTTKEPFLAVSRKLDSLVTLLEKELENAD